MGALDGEYSSEVVTLDDDGLRALLAPHVPRFASAGARA
jgi:hypothetical protein